MRDSKQTTEQFALAMTRWVGSPGSVVLHTALFVGSFLLAALGLVQFERMLLVVTTLVSLEAIYLSIFIQMSVNHQAKALASVEKDIDEIAEDVEEIAEDVEEIAEDVEDIQETHEEIQEDIEEIQKDVDEIQEDVEEIQKDVDEITGEGDEKGTSQQ